MRSRRSGWGRFRRPPGLQSDHHGRHLDTQVRDTPIALLNRNGSEQGATVTLAGFGRTGTGLTGSNQGNNTKRAGRNVIDSVQNNRVMKVDFDRPNSSTPNALGSATPLMLEIRAGPGDSDGSMLLENGGRVHVEGDTRVGAFLAGNATLQIFDGHLKTRSLAIHGAAMFTFLGGPMTGLAGQTFALGPVFAAAEGHLLHLKNGASMALLAPGALMRLRRRQTMKRSATSPPSSRRRC